MKLYAVVTYYEDLFSKTPTLELGEVFTSLADARRQKEVIKKLDGSPLAILVYDTEKVNLETGALIISDVIED